MADGKPFTPQFGPNGAVMNAPTMTPGMRRKIEESDRMAVPPPKTMIRLGRRFVAATIVAWVIVHFAVHFVHGLGDPPESELFVGVLLAVLSVMGLAVLGRETLQRWEIGKQMRDRKLLMPNLARWMMAGFDLATVAGLTLADILRLLAGSDSHKDIGWFLAYIAVALSALAGAAMRRLARMNKWDLPR